MMKKISILTVAALSLLAMNTTAQLPPLDAYPWADNLVYQARQLAIDPDALFVAEANLHLSLVDWGEPCVVDETWPADVQALVLEVCDELNQNELDVDRHVVASILTDLANSLEVDTDGDGVPDSQDACPLNNTVWDWQLPSEHINDPCA